MEVIKEFDNKLLNRKEIEGKIPLGSSPIPSRAKVKKDLAKKLSVDEKLIIINKITAGYGSSEVKVEANIYNDVETLKKVTNEHIIKRNQTAQEESAEGSEEKKEE